MIFYLIQIKSMSWTKKKDCRPYDQRHVLRILTKNMSLQIYHIMYLIKWICFYYNWMIVIPNSINSEVFCIFYIFLNLCSKKFRIYIYDLTNLRYAFKKVSISSCKSLVKTHCIILQPLKESQTSKSIFEVCDLDCYINQTTATKQRNMWRQVSVVKKEFSCNIFRKKCTQVKIWFMQKMSVLSQGGFVIRRTFMHNKNVSQLYLYLFEYRDRSKDLKIRNVGISDEVMQDSINKIVYVVIEIRILIE